MNSPEAFQICPARARSNRRKKRIEYCAKLDALRPPGGHFVPRGQLFVNHSSAKSRSLGNGAPFEGVTERYCFEKLAAFTTQVPHRNIRHTQLYTRTAAVRFEGLWH